MKKLVFLISNAGSGTNLQSVIDAIEDNRIHATILAVISDASDARGVIRAKDHGIETYVLKQGENVEKIVSEYAPDYICLTGWKQIITDSFLKTFENKILNLHPGLIPDTMDGEVKNPDGTTALWNKGMFMDKAITNFLVNKATYAGSSIHFLSQEFDFGTVLARGFVSVEPDDKMESLYARLKEKENQLYVEALQKLCN